MAYSRILLSASDLLFCLKLKKGKLKFRNASWVYSNESHPLDFSPNVISENNVMKPRIVPNKVHTCLVNLLCPDGKSLGVATYNKDALIRARIIKGFKMVDTNYNHLDNNSPADIPLLSKEFFSNSINRALFNRNRISHHTKWFRAKNIEGGKTLVGEILQPSAIELESTHSCDILTDSHETSRIFNGEGDGIPGLYIDLFIRSDKSLGRDMTPIDVHNPNVSTSLLRKGRIPKGNLTFVVQINCKALEQFIEIVKSALDEYDPFVVIFCGNSNERLLEFTYRHAPILHSCNRLLTTSNRKPTDELSKSLHLIVDRYGCVFIADFTGLYNRGLPLSPHRGLLQFLSESSHIMLPLMANKIPSDVVLECSIKRVSRSLRILGVYSNSCLPGELPISTCSIMTDHFIKFIDSNSNDCETLEEGSNRGDTEKVGLSINMDFVDPSLRNLEIARHNFHLNNSAATPSSKSTQGMNVHWNFRSYHGFLVPTCGNPGMGDSLSNEYDIVVVDFPFQSDIQFIREHIEHAIRKVSPEYGICVFVWQHTKDIHANMHRKLISEVLKDIDRHIEQEVETRHISTKLTYRGVDQHMIIYEGSWEIDYPVDITLSTTQAIPTSIVLKIKRNSFCVEISSESTLES